MKNRILAFFYAFRGIGSLLKETHFRIHILALVLVCFTGWQLNISSQDWINILLVSALVITLEAINSSIESLADAIHPEHHPLIKKTKDIAAGAVLIASIFAILVALVLFTPYLT